MFDHNIINSPTCLLNMQMLQDLLDMAQEQWNEGWLSLVTEPRVRGNMFLGLMNSEHRNTKYLQNMKQEVSEIRKTRSF